MTRNRKYDYEAIKREYIFDSGSPPISYTDLAEKHGMPRSLVSDRGIREGWADQREEFRKALGVRTTEAMADENSRFQVALRQKSIAAGLEYLDGYLVALRAGEIKYTTRDMVAVAAMVRVLTADAAAERQPGEEALLNEDTPMSTESLKNALRLLESGELSERPEGDAPQEPATAVGED